MVILLASCVLDFCVDLGQSRDQSEKDATLATPVPGYVSQIAWSFYYSVLHDDLIQHTVSLTSASSAGTKSNVPNAQFPNPNSKTQCPKPEIPNSNRGVPNSKTLLIPLIDVTLHPGSGPPEPNCEDVSNQVRQLAISIHQLVHTLSENYPEPLRRLLMLAKPS